jgi:hypothetical protein
MSRTRKIGVPTVVLLGALALAGCSNSAFTIDPYKREGIWKPSGVNDTNLAAHVANPTDLARGREDARGSRRTPVVAVERLWSGAPPARAAQASQSGQGGAAGAQQAPR